jgi:hypothetical protein
VPLADSPHHEWSQRFAVVAIGCSLAVACMTSDSRPSLASTARGGAAAAAEGTPSNGGAAAAPGASPSATPAASRVPTPSLVPITPDQLVVTSGNIVLNEATPADVSHESTGVAKARPVPAAVLTGPGQFSILAPTFRAWLGQMPRPAIELEFIYRGPSSLAAPLASGELRRQIGVELRAQNACNVVYVMWHIAPASRLQVSVKSNPGQTSSAQCGDHGYTVLQPSASRPVAAVEPGQRHVVRAEVQGSLLQVLVDGVTSWAGGLPPAALAFDGPVGIRSDNGDFDVELRAPRPTG